MINIDELNSLIKLGNAKSLAEYMKTHNLVLNGNKIVCSAPEYVKAQVEYWDKRQLVKKLSLNATYGTLLNAGSRFFDQRLGQSVTLTGRQVVKHMAAKTNEIITGEYDYRGNAIIYGDSVTGDSIIATSQGQLSIADLYNSCGVNYTKGSKEYGINDSIQVTGFDLDSRVPIMSNINYVMRHYTTKKLYKITLDNNLVITVTQDHSVIVYRNNTIVKATPIDIAATDQFICLDQNTKNKTDLISVKSVEPLGAANDYVYDISVADDNHLFFANNCLVHNTDSCRGDTIIRSNWGELPIESLYNCGSLFWEDHTNPNRKEYSYNSDLQVMSYDNVTGTPYYDNISYIYRHKVSKEQWVVETEDGTEIVVTGDHSIMVERDGSLIEVKPRDIVETDVLIQLV